MTSVQDRDEVGPQFVRVSPGPVTNPLSNETQAQITVVGENATTDRHIRKLTIPDDHLERAFDITPRSAFELGEVIQGGNQALRIQGALDLDGCVHAAWDDQCSAVSQDAMRRHL
ncbi:hypothetical protein ACFS2C_22375 [Prauserella oleivorans]|uniref:Uncharacterized protein n=2 Tax=Pseudonocardiaceae TaxID=2070 RepID=A0A8E1WA68_9PSEU|nr:MULTISPECIES: hypothetical protein [Pseudonocardiaceae]MBB2506368.1 hypothetical protein [Amycolatopsis echigonensis]MCF6428048.1 hypothetical protein [Amycolatopsis tucumanensis]